MELHQLQYVLEVAKHRHFTKAAEEICVAQSSLSQQISKLEEELGVKLFTRTTRSVTLTSAGQEFVVYARRILAELEVAKQSMQAHVGLTKGTLNIGAITTLESINFVSLITAFHKAFPGIYLNIVSNGSYRLAQSLLADEIHVALLTPPVDNIPGELDFYPLASDEFVIVMSTTHPLAGRSILDLQDVAREDFVFPSPDQSIYKIYWQACRDAGFSPNIVCQISHSETSLSLVADGVGISFFPLDTLLAAKPEHIAFVRLANPLKKRLALALPRLPHYTPPVAAFRDFVLNWVKNQLARPDNTDEIANKRARTAD